MILPAFAKLPIFAGLLVLLAGCVDADLDVKLTSTTTASATLIQVMNAQFYSMIKPPATKIDPSGQTEQGPEIQHFCADGTLTQSTDGSATCLITASGPFAGLALGKHQKLLSFAPAGAGLVRVAFDTGGLLAETGASFAHDEETEQMNQSVFSGHTLTLHFSGLEVIDTNMTLSDDKTSAVQAIQFLEIINGTAKLPKQLFAVIRVK
ncbi:hypothetical protein [Devosia sp.]|uniref:hypothetical protein n=1 Tax=Devosia sp. TaxID=1871048 RepID=UPI0032667E04